MVIIRADCVKQTNIIEATINAMSRIKTIAPIWLSLHPKNPKKNIPIGQNMVPPKAIAIVVSFIDCFGVFEKRESLSNEMCEMGSE